MGDVAPGNRRRMGDVTHYLDLYRTVLEDDDQHAEDAVRAVIAATFHDREALRVAGDRLADAVRALDSYASLGGAPVERTDRADAALAAWEALDG